MYNENRNEKREYVCNSCNSWNCGCRNHKYSCCWKGDKGDPGPIGPQGKTGQQGPQGPEGPQGIQGERGLQGPQGIQGERGYEGSQGIQGIQGEPGPQGAQGSQGPQGIQGVQGERGLEGPKGPQGVQGLQGEEGPQGIQGERGPEGPQGVQGERGAEGPQGLQGIQGERGPEGPQGVQGQEGPRGPKGDKGDSCDVYHADLSEPNSFIDIPIGDIYYHLQYQLATELRLYFRPLDTDVSVLIDMKRFSQYDGLGIDGYFQRDNYILSANLEIDTIIYNESREMHRIWLRQQNPVTGLWSLDEINLFASNRGERITVWICNVYKNVNLD